MLFTCSNISISSLCLSKEGALSEQIKRPQIASVMKNRLGLTWVVQAVLH